jgi:predicted permease
VSRWLVGVALIVLLTACFNVTNLLIARAMRRQREMAVRVALGSGRWRLMRLVLSEGLLLSVLAGIAALLMAMWTGGIVRNMLLPAVQWTSPPVDLRVLGMTVALVIIVAMFTGLLPALHAVRPDLTTSLQGWGRGGGASLHRTRRILTVSQAALSVMLLIGAGLFVRSLVRVQGEDLGVDTGQVLVAYFRLAPEPRDSAAAANARARRAGIYERALARARALPGVAQGSLAVGLPFGSAFGVDLRVPGWDSLPGSTYVSAVTPGYFEGVGTRRLRGRTFGEADRAGSAPVAIVNQTMASTLWPGRDPIGECITIGQATQCARIVGIVADARQNAIQEAPSMHYYIPYGQEQGFGGTELIVRPAGDAASLIPALRRALLSVDPSVLYVDLEVMDHFLESEVRPWRLGASLFVLMGALALVVAAVGLYSVMSYFVVQRTPEIGLRLALGATGGRVARLVLGGSVALATSGVAIGCFMAFVGTRYLDTLLYKTSPRDPLVFLGSAGVLLAMSVVAGVVPAWRARRVNPMVALRTD